MEPGTVAEKPKKKLRKQGSFEDILENEVNVRDFPYKVDELLEQANRVFFEGRLKLNDKKWLKSVLKKDKDGEDTEDDDLITQ